MAMHTTHTTSGAGLMALPRTHSDLVHVRLGGKRDRGLVCRMEGACFGWTRLLFGLWPRMGDKDVAAWISEVNGRPVGYLIAYEKKLDGQRVWYVGGVGVLEPYRHTGIGRRLMGAVLADHPTLWLHVRAGNRAALNLYARLDMRELRRLKRFYSNGEDALVMVTPDLA